MSFGRSYGSYEMSGLGGTLSSVTEADVLRKDLTKALDRVEDLKKEVDRRQEWYQAASKRAEDLEGKVDALQDAVQYWRRECDRLKDQVEFWHGKSQDMMVEVRSDYHDDGGERGKTYNEGWDLGYNQGMEAAVESLDDRLEILRGEDRPRTYELGFELARDLVAKELKVLKEQLGDE